MNFQEAYSPPAHQSVLNCSARSLAIPLLGQTWACLNFRDLCALFQKEHLFAQRREIVSCED
jgi:hypothetical protein